MLMTESLQNKVDAFCQSCLPRILLPRPHQPRSSPISVTVSTSFPAPPSASFWTDGESSQLLWPCPCSVDYSTRSAERLKATKRKVEVDLAVHRRVWPTTCSIELCSARRCAQHGHDLWRQLCCTGHLFAMMMMMMMMMMMSNRLCLLIPLSNRKYCVRFSLLEASAIDLKHWQCTEWSRIFFSNLA